MSLTFPPMNNQAAIPRTTANSNILVTLTSLSQPSLRQENAIFKSGTTLENFISTNNRSGKSRGENDKEYLTDFSVNASQSEIDQSSDDESNCGPPP